MKKVFVSPDFIVTSQLNDFLNSNGVQTEIRNQTPFVIPGVFPEIWVLKDADTGTALELIRDWQRSESRGEPQWTCSHCGELVESQFNSCWKCSAEKPK